MAETLIEYVSFRAGDVVREYQLWVRCGTEGYGVTVAIPNEAFLSGRVRYQDGPDISYLKVQREIAAAEAGVPPGRDHWLTDEELAEYKASHSPKKPKRRG